MRRQRTASPIRRRKRGGGSANAAGETKDGQQRSKGGREMLSVHRRALAAISPPSDGRSNDVSFLNAGRPGSPEVWHGWDPLDPGTTASNAGIVTPSNVVEIFIGLSGNIR